MRRHGLTVMKWCGRWAVPGVVAAVLGIAAPVQAGFPGKPGMIVFSSTFTGDREIFVAAADGSGRVDLTRDRHADITPSWSADGKRIAFASDRSGAMEIYLMNADGSGVAQLTHDSAFADHPRLTADGRYVVYESKKGGNWEIRRIGTDGSGEVDLTRNRASDRYPATSPNGRRIAFSSNRGTSGTHIWAMNTQGSALKPVTLRRGNQFEPSWAPAGGRLAYVSGTLSAGTNIWTVLVTGKGDHRLTPLQADEQLNPSWSPDAHSIVYEDCLAGNIAGCTVMVKPLGGSPVDISTLRAPFLDTFDAGVQDRAWNPHQDGTGAQTSAQNGQLVMSIAADATQGGTFNRIDGGWLSACQLAGDFDVQADYQLLQWPVANGVQATLDASDLGAGPFRESQTYGESYGSFIPPAGAQSTITAESAGTLRIQRQGDTASTSYKTSGGGWAPIQSSLVPAVPTFIGLDISSMNNFFSHQTVTIAWDNFRINSGTMSCPNLSWEDDTPDWQAAPA
jgi:TolB protein